MMTTVRDRDTTVIPRISPIAAIAVGLIAGIVSSAIGWIVGQPTIDESIAWEMSEQGDPGLYVPEMSRFTQQIGMVVALCGAAMALAAIAAVLIFVIGRKVSVTARSVLLATALAWFVFVGVPFVLAPPSPPGTGAESDVVQRTVRWTATIAIGLLAVFIAVCAQKALERSSPRSRPIMVTAAGLIAVVALAAFLPAGAVTPAGFPADVLWQFRLASLATQTALWVTVGVGYWWLLQPSRRAARESHPWVRG